MKEYEILLQMKKENFENFNIIYKNYYKKIFFLSLKSIGDEKLAEDLTQEVFMDVIVNIKNLNEIEKFSSWISKITINKTNTKLKKLCLQKKYTYNYNEIFFENFIVSHDEPENLLLKKDLRKSLIYEINKLSQIKRRVMLHYFFKELSLKEISDLERIPIGTVKSRLHYAKKVLKNLMLENYLLFIVFKIILINKEIKCVVKNFIG